MTIEVITPAVLAVVFAIWGVIDELNGISPLDQFIVAVVCAVWAVVRSKG